MPPESLFVYTSMPEVEPCSNEGFDTAHPTTVRGTLEYGNPSKPTNQSVHFLYDRWMAVWTWARWASVTVWVVLSHRTQTLAVPPAAISWSYLE